MKALRIAASLALLACARLCAAGEAQSGAPPTESYAVPEVVISATRVGRDSFGLPVAIDSVGQSAIREDRPEVNLSESLGRVPGVSVLNRQNYAQDLQISSRGFGARSTFGVRGIRLIADAIPATSPDGQAQPSSFDLSSVERVEVMRGPFSALYGNASGGVIQVFTADGPPQPTLTGSFYAGSYGTYKAGAQFGGDHGPWNYLTSASRFHTDGYREHSTATREQANAKIKVRSGSGVATIVLNSFDQPEALDPLGLTGAQAAADPRQADRAALLFNTRKSARQNQIGLIYERAVGDNSQLQARVYAGDRQVNQYLAIPLGAQLLPTASGGVVDLDRGYQGWGLRWTQDAHVDQQPLTVTAGVDYDHQGERRRGFINDYGIAGALKRDEDDKVTNSGVYAQIEWRPAAQWNLMAGLRHSRVNFDSIDYFIANGDDSGAVRFARTTPAAGVMYSATPGLNLYVNVGRGFETPTFTELAYRPDGEPGLNFALQPARSWHREAGVKAKIGAATRGNLALFRVTTSDEIVVNTSAGGRTTYKNAPGTLRDGAELSLQSHVGKALEIYVAYTWLHARFTQPFTAGTPALNVASGNRLPGVPQNALYGEFIWRHAASGFHAAAEVRSSARIYVNDVNSEFAAGYTIGNLRLGFEQRSRNWRLTEFLRVDNVTGRAYVGSVIVGEASGRFYEPAPDRNYLLGVTAEASF